MSEMIRKADLKVWWVLGWEQYYPCGALRNVAATFKTKEEADESAENIRIHGGYDYVEVENVSRMLGIED